MQINGYYVIITERIILRRGDKRGDRPHNYVSNDIFGFAVSPGNIVENITD